MWKIKLYKIIGNLLDEVQTLYMHERNGLLELFSRPQVIENIGNISFSEQIFYRKQSLGAPVSLVKLLRSAVKSSPFAAGVVSTFLRAKCPQRRTARRNGCFHRLKFERFVALILLTCI